MILHKLKYRANEGLIHSAKKQNKNKTKQKQKTKQKMQKGFDCCATLYLELWS